MTAKQKAARAKFKAVVKEAGKLRKKNPSLTQAEAVKQAWAISYGKKRAGVGETHKDTKSHNVNIRVVSGIKNKKKIGSAYLDRLKEQQAKAEREREAEKTKRQRPTVASKRVREVLKKQGLKMPSGYKVDERKITGIGAIKSSGVKMLQKKFGILAAKKLMKKKKSEAKKLQREMTKVKTQLKKLLSL
jgi:hypothetical protein